MKTIDIHCHLQHEHFDKDREKIIREAKDKMHFLIVSGAKQNWNISALELHKKHSNFIYATLGLHPCDAIRTSEKEFENVLEFIVRNKKDIVGIGEIGLDYHWIKEKRSQQKEKEKFKRLLELSKDLRLPVVIHSWDAEAHAVKMLNDEDIKKAVMHCFSGKREDLVRALQSGYYISFSTQILFSKRHKKLAKNTPLNKILIETDAPWLDPNHGRRNMPWNTLIVAEKIATLKKMQTEEVLNQVVGNARDVFGIECR